MTRIPSCAALVLGFSSILGIAAPAPATRLASPPSIPQHPLAGREPDGAAADPASISAFVSDLRLRIERSALPSGQPARSFQEASARLIPALPGAPRCLSPVVVEISRQAGSSPMLTAYAGAALTPPVLAHEMVFTSTDGAFAIHYTLDRASGDAVVSIDRDANGSPDYVDLVAAALDKARVTLTGRMSFRDPATAAPMDIYLANLGGRIDGFTVPVAGEDGASTIVLDSRLLGNDALLRAAVAHQYAHASLWAYTPLAPVWWSEATSAWLEGVVVGSYGHYTDQMQAAIESSSDGLGSDDARLIQGHLLWPLYLASHGGEEALVRRIWESLEQQGDATDLWRATDDVLRAAGTTIEASFADYTLWVLLSGERSDGKHFTVADRLAGVSFTGRYDAYPAAAIQIAPHLAPLGTAYVRFAADGLESGLRLRFEGDLPGSFQAQVLLTPRRPGAPLSRAPIQIDARGRGSIGIPWATFSEAILIVGNVARGGGDATYSFVARSEPNFPFEIVSFQAQPSENDVRLTWETQSENGLFGWIVTRGERPSGAARRINQFIVPAIGDGDGPVSYQYVDDGVTKGRTYFYTLIGVTQDGLTRESPETRVDLPR